MKNQKNNDDTRRNKEFEEMDLQRFTKMNPYDLSFGSVKNKELKYFIVRKMASAVSNVMSESFEEIAKVRQASFVFIASEYEKASNAERLIIDTYISNQSEIFEQITKSIASTLTQYVSQIKDDLGKTQAN